MHTTKALIVVDMQRDFLTGTLPVPRALELIGPIGEEINKAYDSPDTIVVATQCWHPANHCSFKEQGGPWPAHCIANSSGAELHPYLAALVPPHDRLRKGLDPNVDEYSAFDSGQLDARLRIRGITHLRLCGVARNVCVDATYKSAIALQCYTVEVLEHLCREV